MSQIPSQPCSGHLKKISMQLLMLVMVNSCRCSHTHAQPCHTSGARQERQHRDSLTFLFATRGTDHAWKCAALEQDSVLNLSLFPNYLYKNKSKVNVPCDSSATALQLSKPPASLHQSLKQELASLAASTIRRWPRKKELQSASIQNGHVDMAVFCWFLCTFSLFFAYCLVNF